MYGPYSEAATKSLSEDLAKTLWTIVKEYLI